MSGGGAVLQPAAPLTDLLEQCPLFSTTPPSVRRQLAERLVACELATGSVLGRASGSPGLYIIQSGRLASVVRNARAGTTQVLATLDPPEAVGASALVLGVWGEIEYAALAPTVVHRLSREVFEAVMRQVPEFAVAVSQSAAADAAELTRYGAIPWVDLGAFSFDERLWSCLPAALAAQAKICPLEVSGDIMTVAVADPRDVSSLDALSTAVPGLRFRVVACALEDLRRFVKAGSPQQREQSRPSSAPPAGNDPRPTFRFLTDEAVSRDAQGKTPSTPPPAVHATEEILETGLTARASDIHIEPERQGVVVRYRVDGVLYRPREPFPSSLAKAIVNRLKTLARLDITETRKPQDGRISVQLASGRLVDLRISTVPAKFGEKVALRVLDSEDAVGDLKTLFVVDQVRNLVTRLLARKTGLILVTGPTGSGKSTTLYSALNFCRAQHVNIMTVEDPIEYHLDGVTQVEVHPEAGATFATILRALLRQDPNIILVGEMRDAETARIAAEASLTGHLILSSLHSNGTLEAVARMRDMGIESYALANGLLAVVHQRLVQRTCPHCVAPFEYPPFVIDTLIRHGVLSSGHVPPLMKGTGCAQCRQTGMRGRVAVYGTLVVNDELREAIGQGAGLGDMRAVAARGAHIELARYAGALLRMGVTVPGEVLPLVQHIEDRRAAGLDTG